MKASHLRAAARSALNHSQQQQGERPANREKPPAGPRPPPSESGHFSLVSVQLMNHQSKLGANETISAWGGGGWHFQKTPPPPGKKQRREMDQNIVTEKAAQVKCQ